MIKLIVAIDPNNLIGSGTQMPWHIKEEFKHFKETTLNHALLFGQNTFTNLPSKLANRISYVFGFTKTPSADFSITSEQELQNLFDKFRNSEEILFISGGKYIYETYFHEAEELIVSELKNIQNGDVYLNWDLSNYKKTLLKEFEEFNVYSYKKKFNV
ncbi:dihydrofolate reductase [[Mycoplasma] mobile]|uniref:dihydrofolate reductase n=1 Tax=Mycoplasma mobile (strain ATCC 43663 / 163K / NCTC 11711) TaxID=267748 RepID=Q6KIQ5_MYCM1|nr:dihydrofolate reductase [[Mycoplasma] mobile]AAT27521.1 dihydrofolate reductase [Mycoplasma mobile 163K]